MRKNISLEIARLEREISIAPPEQMGKLADRLVALKEKEFHQ